MTKRIEKVNSLLEHEIGALITKNFVFTDLVTLTHVDATANLQEARVYISVMPEEHADKVVKILNNDVQSIQKEINKKLNMRPIPRIMFLKDMHASEAGRIEKLLEKIKKTDITE